MMGGGNNEAGSFVATAWFPTKAFLVCYFTPVASECTTLHVCAAVHLSLSPAHHG